MKATLARTIAHNLLVVLAFAAVVTFGLATQDKDSITRPAVVNANTLVAEHGCTNQEDPTHAVVTIDGRTRYVGQRLTDLAIEQAVFGVDHGLIVHGFCA